jgi:TolA-binding protein
VATRLAVIWTLLIAVFWLSVYGFFTRYFDGSRIAEKKLATMRLQVHESERQVARLQFRFNEYKDFLASSGVRVDDNATWSDPKRIIASVISDPQTKENLIPFTPGNQILQQAREVFARGQFADAQVILTQFMRDYPDNPNLPEAAFMMMECQAARGQLENVVKSIDFIVSHFPETEYAGYALVRLGKIYEHQELLEEACDIYRIVVREFPKTPGAEVAAGRLKDLRL